MKTRALIPVSAVVGLAIGALAHSGPSVRVAAQDHGGGGHGRRGGDRPATDVGGLFREQCASCHVTPDPGVATDRAYIRQLQETA